MRQRKTSPISVLMAICMVPCLFFSTGVAEQEKSYHISMPRIEATHYDELIASDGESIDGSVSYSNARLWSIPGGEGSIPIVDRIKFDTLELAGEQLSFPIARPTYLPEGARLADVTLTKYRDTEGYLNIRYGYAVAEVFISVEQYDVGPEAVLNLETVEQIEKVEYDGQAYLCGSSKLMNTELQTLYWLEDDFSYRAVVSGPIVSVALADEESGESTHPYRQIALQLAASMTLDKK